MLQNFCIVHRRKPHVFGSSEQVPVWATCLRSLAFTQSPASIDIHSQDQIFTGPKAYAFLLEIICGLHSPIVGETEVFGQFKIFLTEWLNRQPECSSLVQKILGDAKVLRSKYLSHLGNQSYGSWLRKNVKSSEVHILGGGQLVQEILPYLNKQGKSVVMHVRNPRKVDFFSGEVHSLDAQAFSGRGALIIAAPMTAPQIHNWMGTHSRPEQIFDLRDNSHLDPVLNSFGESHGLRAIFDQIETNKSKLLPVIERVKSEIVECADKMTAQALVRPQGWDDLCA